MLAAYILTTYMPTTCMLAAYMLAAYILTAYMLAAYILTAYMRTTCMLAAYMRTTCMYTISNFGDFLLLNIKQRWVSPASIGSRFHFQTNQTSLSAL